LRVPVLCIEPQDLYERALVGRFSLRDLDRLAEVLGKKADVL
jgi:hypothetical protein